MRLLILIFVALFYSPSTQSQNPTFQWAKSFGGISGDDGYKTLKDASGNVYIMGSFRETVDFDPGPGVYNMTSVGQGDIFISKFDASGNFLWVKTIGSNSDDEARSMNIDNNGNLYLTGSFSGTVDFDPGSAIYNLTNTSVDYNAYVLKLDSSGNFVWAKKIVVADASIGFKVIVSVTGNVFIGGTFTGTGDFDPGISVFTMSSPSTNQDVFITKLDNSGNFIWAKQFTGNSGKGCYSLGLDQFENIYVAGYFLGTVDFDPGPGVYNLKTINPNFNSDAYVCKLDLNGNFIYAKQFSGLSDAVVAFELAVDQTGSVFVTGYFSGVADFESGPGTYFLTTGLLTNAFVLKLDNSGNLAWAKAFNNLSGTNPSSAGVSISLDNLGNVYTSGHFSGGIDFDPSGSLYVLNSVASVNTYISKLSPNGSFIFALQIGGSSYTNGYSLIVDSQRNIFLTGRFFDTGDFDPSLNIFNLTSAGVSDVFILKLSQLCLFSTNSTIAPIACNSYTLNGQTYTSSGTYTQTLVNSAGCDSIIIINLTLNGSNSTNVISSCNNYIWQGNTYTLSGTYQVIYPNIIGCDSTLNLILTIKHSVSTNINASICVGQSYAGHTSTGNYVDTYTAVSGCDSTRALSLVVKPKSQTTINMTICKGQNFEGHSTTGVFTSTFNAANGCDSIRTLNLNVISLKYSIVDTSICEGEHFLAGGQFQTNSGTFKDTLQSNQGCDSIVTTNLIVNPKPKPNLGLDKDLCSGNSITLNPGTFVSSEWQDMTHSPTFTITHTGLYWVIVKNNFNCSASDSIRINAIHLSPSNFLTQIDSVCENENLIIKSLNNYRAYTWSNNTFQNNITVTKPGFYWLSVQDIYGCIGKDTIEIKPKSCISQVFIPSAFTPNKDGKNDIFKAIVHGKILKFQLELYDRYGHIIFKSNNFNDGWDGNYKGDPFNSGAFIWQCFYQLEGKQNEYQKGASILLR